MRARSTTTTTALLELVGEAYGFGDLDEFRPGILEVLDRAVPSLFVSYNEVGVTPDRTFSIMLPRAHEELVPVFARLSHQNPLLAEYRRTGDGRPRRFSDLIDQASYYRLELYRECYRLMGVESQIAFTLPARPPMVLGIALSRGEEDYSDAEVELLGLARPYLIQAYRNAELSSARAAALRAAESGLESLGRHVVVLDGQGRVEFATDTARRRLGGRDGLPAGVREWIADQRGHLSSSEPLVLRTDGAPVLVRLLPRRADDHRDVLLIEGGTGELTVPALRGLGLTERQAETLQWVALGYSVASAAAHMGIARRTADKHLQHVYAKLGVTSLAQATATAWAAVGASLEVSAASAASGSSSSA
jgi:DNA-binding CsgD family transcriptional regulator